MMKRTVTNITTSFVYFRPLCYPFFSRISSLLRSYAVERGPRPGTALPGLPSQNAPYRQTNGRDFALQQDSSDIVPFRKTNRPNGQLSRNGPKVPRGLGHWDRSGRRSYEHSNVSAPRHTDSRGPLLKDILSEAEKAGSFEALEAECDRRISSGEHLDRRIVTTLIRSYGSSGSIEKAISLFERIGTSPELRNIRIDAHHYCSAISACKNASQLETALELLQRSKTDDRVFPNPNRFIYSAAMSACINVGEYSKAVELFEEFENLAAKKNTKLDSTLCNTALKAYAKLGEHAKALLLFSRMKSNNINRDIISFIALLSSCSKAGDWQEAEVLLEEINHSKWLSPNLEVYTLLISSCLRSNQTDRALEYFKIVCERSNSYQTALGNGETDLDIEMEATETRKNMRIAPPDACLLNILIPGIAHSQASLAIRLYDEMLASKLQPTQVTSVAIIQAIARSEDRKKALLIFYDAVKLGLFRQCRKDADVTHAPIEGSTFRLKLVDLDDAVVSTRLLGAVQYYKRIIGGSRVLKAPDLLFIVGDDLKKSTVVKEFLNQYCLRYTGNEKLFRLQGRGVLKANVGV